MATDPALEHAIASLAIPDVLIAHRLIADNDKDALFPQERSAFATSVDKVQRASGAARIVARSLMQQLGVAPRAIPKSATGAPRWPDGLIGSLAHDARVAIAALARSGRLQSLGVDVEPAQPLDSDLIAMIATPRERIWVAEAPLHGRLLFAIKEAVYKCTNPIDGVFLEHHDVEIDFATRTAATSAGKTVRFRSVQSSHIVVVATI